jgi:hypothetical protein
MIALRSLFGIGVAAAASIATMGSAEAVLGEGRPVVAADLSGKKICWNTGYWDIFAASGEHIGGAGNDPRTHKHHWSVREPGVLIIGSMHRQVEVLPDGRLHIYWYSLIATEHDQDFWGTVCN